MFDLLLLDAPSFMDSLSKTHQAQLRQASVTITYSDGALIHSRGDIKPGLSIVKSGAAHVGVYGEDGSFVMTSRMGPGQCFGEFTLFTDLPRTHDVTASGTTEIYQIPETRFTPLYQQEPDILKALLSTSLMRLHIVIEMLDALRRLPLRERAAKILLSMLRLGGNMNRLEFKQSEFAYTLGVTRVSLNRVLKELAALDLITIGYGYIDIPDTDRLAMWVARNTANTDLPN